MFPVDDWQFWAVSAVVLGVVVGAGWSLVRQRKKRGKTKVQLTVERHTLDTSLQEDGRR